MINTLSQASALNPGADLWVVTDLDHSQWTAKIDWYLNFQIIKASRRAPEPLPEFLQKTIQQTGLEIPQPHVTEASPLLIYSEPLLPAKWVLMVPYAQSFQQWIQQISGVWHKLQKPTLRIFLPTGQTTSELDEKWLAAKDLPEISVVLDLLN